jgi:BON domain
VTVRSRYWFAVLGMCLAQAPLARAQEPVPPGTLGLSHAEAAPTLAPTHNQKMADTIADQLRQSGQLRNYLVNVSYSDRTAVLTGSVADQPQREEVLRIVQGVPGVEKVLDRLSVVDAITQVQAPPRPLPTLPAPTERGPDLSGNAPTPEPMPIFQAPPPNPVEVNPPKMPPNAWPTYAPYNNFSRVAYPTAYPYNAWPYIGPIYPFPKVPLGWRSVKLEWDDGYWWFSKVGNKYDWWRLRFY